MQLIDIGRYILSAIALVGTIRIGSIDSKPGYEVPSTLYFCLTGVTLGFTGKEMIELVSLAKKKIKDNL